MNFGEPCAKPAFVCFHIIFDSVKGTQHLGPTWTNSMCSYLRDSLMVETPLAHSLTVLAFCQIKDANVNAFSNSDSRSNAPDAVHGIAKSSKIFRHVQPLVFVVLFWQLVTRCFCRW